MKQVFGNRINKLKRRMARNANNQLVEISFEMLIVIVLVNKMFIISMVVTNRKYCESGYD